MYTFLGRMGRKRWPGVLANTAGPAGCLVYIFGHLQFHDAVKSLLIAEDAYGNKLQVDNNLRKLIVETYKDTEPFYCKTQTKVLAQMKFPIIKERPKSDLKWFLTSSLDPVGLGLSMMRNGVLIGLPSNLRYQKIEDIGRDALHYRKVNLITKVVPPDPEKQEDVALRQELFDLEEVGSSVAIGRNDKEKQNYKECLVLSDDAKKFVIARQIFYVDSFRPVLQTFQVALGWSFTLAISRAVVKRFGLGTAHVGHRIGAYLMTALLIFSVSVQNLYSLQIYYCEKADTRAMNLGELYRKGAIEYFEKVLERNKILRNSVDELKSSFTPEGDISSSFFALKTYKQRLDDAVKHSCSLETAEDQNKEVKKQEVMNLKT